MDSFSYHDMYFSPPPPPSSGIPIVYYNPTAGALEQMPALGHFPPPAAMVGAYPPPAFGHTHGVLVH
jgi:hypothetical protein